MEDAPSLQWSDVPHLETFKAMLKTDQQYIHRVRILKLLREPSDSSPLERINSEYSVKAKSYHNVTDPRSMRSSFGLKRFFNISELIIERPRKHKIWMRIKSWKGMDMKLPFKNAAGDVPGLTTFKATMITGQGSRNGVLSRFCGLHNGIKSPVMRHKG